MNLLWQYVYERSGDLLSSYLNILPSPPLAHSYLWQLGPMLLCALMFNSRTHNQAGRRAWVCWELTGAQKLRNSDFLQIHRVLLTVASVTAEGLLLTGPGCVGKMTGLRPITNKNFSLTCLVNLTFWEVFPKTPSLARVVSIRSNQSPGLSARSSNCDV